MSTTRFLYLIRQYAALTRKRSVSYAALVVVLVDLYVTGSSRFPVEKSEQLNRRLWAEDVVRREYTPHDPLPPTSRQLPLF